MLYVVLQIEAEVRNDATPHCPVTSSGLTKASGLTVRRSAGTQLQCTSHLGRTKMYTVDVEAGMPELHNRKYSPGGNFLFNLRSFHNNLSNFLHYALHSLSYSRVQPVGRSSLDSTHR
jgi:hypothetical protein